MRNEQITCDGCGGDLTYTGNCVDWRLSLENENIPSRGGFVTAMGISPAIERSQHFCGLNCLDLWSDRRRYRSRLNHEWWENWKAEKGTASGVSSLGGPSCFSYPMPPDDIVKARDAELDAAALEKFPMSHPSRKSAA